MSLLSGIGENMVSGILCGYLRKYSGPQCVNLRAAIVHNVDLYNLWMENAMKEGVRGPREVRHWTKHFPKYQRMMTPQNRQAVAPGTGLGGHRGHPGEDRGRRDVACLAGGPLPHRPMG